MLGQRWSIKREMSLLGVWVALPLSIAISASAWLLLSILGDHGVAPSGLSRSAAIAALAGAALLAAIGGVWYARRLARPADELIEAVQLLTASESQLRRFMDGLPIAVALTNSEGVVLEMNHAALKPARLVAADVRGQRLSDTPYCGADPVVRQALGAALQRAARGERVRFDTRVTLGARSLAVDLMVAPVRDHAGRVVNLVASAVDIEERKRAEQRALALQERYRVLFDGASVPSYMYDIDTLRFIAVNDAAVRHYGFSREHFLTMSLADIRPKEDYELLLEHVDRVERAGVGSFHEVRLRHRKRDGEIIHVDLRIHRLDIEGARAALVSALDVTERVRAEQEAAAREHRLRAQYLGMAKLSRSDALERAGLTAALREIAAVTAEVLNVTRVGIWIFDRTRQALNCLDLYEVSGGHVSGGQLSTLDHPAYFAAVDSDRILAIADVGASPVVASMSASYLVPHGIGAMLDAPIVKLGRRVGVLCNEFVGPARPWHADEETFAMLAADLIGLALEADERLAAQRALQQYSERLGALSRRLLEVQEAERRLIARELHDEVGQALTAVRMHVTVLERVSDPARRASAGRDAIEVVDQAIRQVRNQALDLRPSMLDDLGLVPALRWYVERFAERCGIRVELKAELGERVTTAQQDTVCYRVIQEALTNVARYSQASAVEVLLARRDGMLTVRVHDNGRGFDVAQAWDRARRGDALGLAGMEERVRLVDGKLAIRSSPATGTDVEVTMPLEREAA